MICQNVDMGEGVDEFFFFFFKFSEVNTESVLNFVTFLIVLFEICWWKMDLMSSVPIYTRLGETFMYISL